MQVVLLLQSPQGKTQAVQLQLLEDSGYYPAEQEDEEQDFLQRLVEGFKLYPEAQVSHYDKEVLH